MKNELLSIGEAAKIKQVSAKSLRYYETIGILKPAYVDPSSGYRYYSPNQMIDLDVILTCIELGIPLKSLTDHKTNRGSLNLKELLISGRDTALANIRRAEIHLCVSIPASMKSPSRKSSDTKMLPTHDSWLKGISSYPPGRKENSQ